MNGFLRFTAFAIALVAAPGAVQAGQPAAASPPYVTSDARVPVGDHVLSTRLYRPVGLARYPLVLLVFGSGDESMLDGPYAHLLAAAFASRGIGTLAYDKRGTGTSTGVATGGDFAALGQDAAALARHARRMPEVVDIGVWGISQAGWITPTLVREFKDLRFAILVSPGGVNPYEQVSWFLRGQALGWGLSPQDADAADSMHRAVSLYYAGRSDWRTAQAEVDRHAAAPWFHRVITHPYWDEMTPTGRILSPDSLALAIRRRPRDFEIYRSASSFASYEDQYRVLRSLPTLIIYGQFDQLLPIARSRAVFESALKSEERYPHEFRVIDGASHDIRINDRVDPEYLSAISEWARAQFEASPRTQ